MGRFPNDRDSLYLDERRSADATFFDGSFADGLRVAPALFADGGVHGGGGR